MTPSLIEEKNQPQKSQKPGTFAIKMLRILFYIMFFSGLISGIMLATTKATGDHHIALIGEWAFVIFENGIRIGVSLLGFYYTLRYLRETKQRISTFRRVSFLSFTISSLIIYLFLPLYWGFTELDPKEKLFLLK